MNQITLRRLVETVNARLGAPVIDPTDVVGYTLAGASPREEVSMQDGTAYSFGVAGYETPQYPRHIGVDAWCNCPADHYDPQRGWPKPASNTCTTPGCCRRVSTQCPGVCSEHGGPELAPR